MEFGFQFEDLILEMKLFSGFQRKNSLHCKALPFEKWKCDFHLNPVHSEFLLNPSIQIDLHELLKSINSHIYFTFTHYFRAPHIQNGTKWPPTQSNVEARLYFTSHKMAPNVKNLLIHLSQIQSLLMDK